MKFLIAPDKFKGSLSALEAAMAIRDGLLEVYPTADFDLCPLADGGEGTLDTLIEARGGRIASVGVPGPLGRMVSARWGQLPDGTAVIEAAEALSLARVAPHPLDPGRASSAGLGALMRTALSRGCSRFLIGLGGTATMDGGSGALSELGAHLIDAGGRPLPPGGVAMQHLETLDISALGHWRTREIVALCDVSSPLVGPTGAATVFGPQKGADPGTVEALERGLTRWRDVWAHGSVQGLEAGLGEAGLGEQGSGQTGEPGQAQSRPQSRGQARAQSRALLQTQARERVPGDGAAGGLGFGLRLGLGARLEPGGPYLMQVIGLGGRLAGVDLVICGEGSIDGQSLSGKLVGALAAEAARTGVPVVAIGGQVRSLPDGGDYPFPTLSLYRHPQELREAISRTAEHLKQAAARLGGLLRIGSGIIP